MNRLVLLFVLFVPALSVAVDGVLEINQTCATQTGCFSGDTAGFPVTINGSAGQSYRLTSDLSSTGNADVTFISIATNDVTVDLGGFRIACSIFTPPSSLDLCGETGGAGRGVSVDETATRTGVEVRNGSIVGMGSSGVFLGPRSVVRDLRVSKNGGFGIFAFTGSTVSGSTASQNGFSGIQVDVGSTISGNTASLNAGDGIDCGGGCTISGNTAYDNGDAVSPTVDGIECGFGCTVRENTVRFNSGYGLNLGTDSAYSENVVTENRTGTVAGNGSANDRGGNYCAGAGVMSAFCP